MLPKSASLTQTSTYLFPRRFDDEDSCDQTVRVDVSFKSATISLQSSNSLLTVGALANDWSLRQGACVAQKFWRARCVPWVVRVCSVEFRP